MNIVNLLMVALLLMVAYTDFSKRKVYNVNLLLISLLGFFLSFNEGFEFFYRPWQIGVWAAIIGFLIGIPFYFMRLMGAGDVKLAAALGMFGGPWFLAISWLMTVPVVALISIFFWYRHAGDARKNFGSEIYKKEEKLKIPFGGIWVISFLLLWLYVEFSNHEY